MLTLCISSSSHAEMEKDGGVADEIDDLFSKKGRKRVTHMSSVAAAGSPAATDVDGEAPAQEARKKKKKKKEHKDLAFLADAIAATKRGGRKNRS